MRGTQTATHRDRGAASSHRIEARMSNIDETPGLDDWSGVRTNWDRISENTRHPFFADWWEQFIANLQILTGRVI